MASINLIESFQDFKEAENIDRPTLMKVLEDVFKTLLRKKYGSDDNFDVIVNTEKGDLEIMRHRTIVEDGAVEDPLAEIEYSEAIKLAPDFEVGEDLYEEVDIHDFGRRAILAAKQTLASRIGATTLRAVISDRMPQGVVYTTFHHPVSGANVITTENSDWATNCPEYKVTAVQVTLSNQPSDWQKEWEEREEENKRVAAPMVAAE